MKIKKTTLKDIADQTGVSLGTVHRALNNKEGVGDEVRNLVVKTAQEMHYKPNYVASSLKRKTVRIAVVLPAPSLEGQFYYVDMWKGCAEFKSEISEFNVEILEFPFDQNGETQLSTLLDKILKEYKDQIDGLLIAPLRDNKVGYFVDRLISAGIAVVLLGNDLPKTSRLCCIRPDDIGLGKIAAELMANFVGAGSRILVAAGNINATSHIYNINSFEEYFNKYHPDLHITKIYEQDSNPLAYSKNQDYVYNEVVNALEKYGDIQGMYSCSARNTVPLAKAVQDTKKVGQVKIIGNDLFIENVRMLKAGVINVLLYKNPKKQGYLGLKTLFDYLIKNQFPDGNTIFVDNNIVMKSNLAYYDNY